ncbi:unnamed protein product [Rhizophagus irregularis]|nr:unnamed protein product [Rhizophagus irregularis]
MQKNPSTLPKSFHCVRHYWNFLSISVNRRKVKNEEAERLYKLVGGRFVDLKFVADESLARQSFEVIEKSILDETEKKFRNAQINPKQNIIK